MVEWVEISQKILARFFGPRMFVLKGSRVYSIEVSTFPLVLIENVYVIVLH